MVEISIIMPVYNSEKYLEKCINSILDQKFNSFELLLIDDGSSDDSPQICEKFAAKDDRVKVFHKSNGGICEARNFGLQKARGNYIAFSDHDDIVKQGFLQENYEIAKKTNADVIKFGREALIIDGDVVKKRDIRKFKKMLLKSMDIKKQFLKLRFDGAMTCVWDGFFKRSFLLNNGIKFNIQYKKGGEDIDFCSKCFAKASTVAFSDKIFYIHYIRIGYSTSTKPDEQRLLKFEMLANNLEECIEFLSINKKKNSFYYMNIVKELVYPSLVYYNNLNEGYDTVKDFLIMTGKKYNKYSPKTVDLIKIDIKWGIYAMLFKNKMYALMYKSLKYKK